MKPGTAKAIISDIKKRGYIEQESVFYPPNQAEKLNISKPKKQRAKAGIKSGDETDYRNIRNKSNICDEFTMFIQIALKIDLWPEFYFSTERLYRFDYAIPEHKIAIEQEGGIWAKGNSGHSSGTGIQRDMDKSNLAQSLGWNVIRRTPEQMKTAETIDLIQKIISNKLV